MDLDKRFAEQAATNAKFVNLDLDADARRIAVTEVAARLRVMAMMEPLSPAAQNVMRVVMAHEPLWHDRNAFLASAAAALSPRAGAPVDSEEVATFLQLTDGDRDATVSSDVDGLKGDYAIRGGRVVRVAGDTEVEYAHGSAGLVRIMDDGAYSVAR